MPLCTYYYTFRDDPNADFIHRIRNIGNKLDYLEKTDHTLTVSQGNYLKNITGADQCTPK